VGAEVEVVEADREAVEAEDAEDVDREAVGAGGLLVSPRHSAAIASTRSSEFIAVKGVGGRDCVLGRLCQ
jgi:D-tyrosyl-tRNA(Tyr) deacylase